VIQIVGGKPGPGIDIGGLEFRGARRIDASLGIFNVFNTGAYTQWNDGANQINTPNYLSRFNRHPPRAAQMTFRYKF